MRFYFHPDAEAEFDEAIHYYEGCQADLGLQFAKEVYATIARIIAYPYGCSAISQNTRRCLMSRFPYGVIYQVKSNTIRIIAIANLHRRPGYWKARIEQNI